MTRHLEILRHFSQSACGYNGEDDDESNSLKMVDGAMAKMVGVLVSLSQSSAPDSNPGFGSVCL